MKITRAWIHQHATKDKGWTQAQLRVLDVPWPPRKGWLSALVGQRISEETRVAFENGGASNTKNDPPRVTCKTPKAKAKVVQREGFLQSYEWRQLRMRVIRKRGARCECCGAAPTDGETVINVDHIKPRRDFPELALTESNLQVLCNVCNHGKGNWDRTDWRQVETVTTSVVATDVVIPSDWDAPMWWGGRSDKPKN